MHPYHSNQSHPPDQISLPTDRGRIVLGHQSVEEEDDEWIVPNDRDSPSQPGVPVFLGHSIEEEDEWTAGNDRAEEEEGSGPLSSSSPVPSRDHESLVDQLENRNFSYSDSVAAGENLSQGTSDFGQAGENFEERIRVEKLSSTILKEIKSQYRCHLEQWVLGRLRQATPNRLVIKESTCESVLLVEARSDRELRICKFWILEPDFAEKFITVPFSRGPELVLGNWYSMYIQKVDGQSGGHRSSFLRMRHGFSLKLMDQSLRSFPKPHDISRIVSVGNFHVLQMRVQVVRRNTKETVRFWDEVLDCLELGPVVMLGETHELPAMQPEVCEETYLATVEPLPKQLRIALGSEKQVCWRLVQLFGLVATKTWAEVEFGAPVVGWKEAIEAEYSGANRTHNDYSLARAARLQKKAIRRKQKQDQGNSSLVKVSRTQCLASLVKCVECAEGFAGLLETTCELMQGRKLLALKAYLQNETESKSERISYGSLYFYHLLEDPSYCRMLRTSYNALYRCALETLHYNQSYVSDQPNVDVIRLCQLMNEV